MYKRWIGWLTEVNQDLSLTKRLAEFDTEKRFCRNEIIHLQYEAHRQYLEYSKCQLALARAKARHAYIDLEKAKIDGRLTICECVQIEVDTQKKVMSVLKGMSKAQREQLLKELGGFDEDLT